MIKNKNKKISIVESIIYKLILSGESYISVKRLNKAVNLYIKQNEIDSTSTRELLKQIDKSFSQLYFRHNIIPDVLNGNGYIIALNSPEAEKSLYEFIIRQPPFQAYFAMFFSREEAKMNLKNIDYNDSHIINNIFTNYVENYNDYEEIFGKL